MLSEKAQKIWEMKYARTLPNGEKETWEQGVWRVAYYVAQAEREHGATEDEVLDWAKLFYQIIANKMFIPGGRILANAGTSIKNLFNCVSSETLVHTNEGVYKAEELVNKTVDVLTSDGSFHPARWSNYGKQHLYEVTLENGDTIFATLDHEWEVTKPKGGREVVTTEELVGRRIPIQIYPENTFIYNDEEYIEGVKNGLVFGDGYIDRDNNCSILRQFGDSMEIIPRFFNKYAHYTNNNNYPDFYQVYGLPVEYKNIPQENKSRSYLRGFIAGWIAADGCVDSRGHVMAHNKDLETLEKIRHLCMLAGIPTVSISKTRNTNPFNGEESSMYKLVFVKAAVYNERMILLKKHRDKLFDSPKPTKTQTIKVVSVKNTDRLEDVYCCVEPITHTMVVGNNYLTKQCFVIPVEDSRHGIYDALGTSAEVFAHGGGVGYNFSALRERGAPVKSTGGRASGPVSFMELFDHTGEVISQASRRGAQMGILNVDHPDIKRFINYKSYPSPKNRRIVKEIDSALDGTTCEGLGTDIVQRILTDNQLTHFNISVGISDAFMEAVKNDTEWSLTSRVDGSVVKTVSARDLLRLIAESAWRSGDPGVIFLDRMEEDNMVPYLGKLEATNPCSEVTLLPNEPCCLGSINLSEMVEDGLVSEKKLSYVTTIATRFLDNVHTLNNTPIEIINETARRTRRLGLGVMGWADMLVKVNVPYDSEDSIRLARAVMSTIQSVAWGTSQYLAEERGTFAAWDREKVENIIPHLYDELPEMRNVAVTSLAPTGSIALLADVNGGIEPFFALAYTRYITEGVGNIPTSKIIEFNPHLEEYLETLDAEDKEKIKGHIKETGVLPDGLDDNAREVFKTAGEISWRDHIRVQAAFQKYVDNAISKTINMPEDSTVEDVMDAYIYAWEMGLKSVALYRDNSKSFQILNK